MSAACGLLCRAGFRDTVGRNRRKPMARFVGRNPQPRAITAAARAAE